MTEKAEILPVTESDVEQMSPQEVTFQEALLEGADFDADAYDHQGEL